MASFVTRTFTIQVNNVAPTLSNFAPSVTSINEAGSVNFGVHYSDPGFDNPANTLDPSNGGGSGRVVYLRHQLGRRPAGSG